jgi:hypothetical protein
VTNAFDELKAACHGQPSIGDADKVKEGESFWLAGRPIQTERGLIGLSLGEDHAVIVSESAVREVAKDEHLYFVRVAAGTPALVRSERVTTLREEAHGCTCSEAPRTDAVARQAGNTGGPGSGPIIIQCPLVCRIEYSCGFYLDRSGLLRRVCVPFLSCRRECPSEPA